MDARRGSGPGFFPGGARESELLFGTCGGRRAGSHSLDQKGSHCEEEWRGWIVGPHRRVWFGCCLEDVVVRWSYGADGEVVLTGGEGRTPTLERRRGDALCPPVGENSPKSRNKFLHKRAVAKDFARSSAQASEQSRTPVSHKLNFNLCETGVLDVGPSAWHGEEDFPIWRTAPRPTWRTQVRSGLQHCVGRGPPRRASKASSE